MNTLNYKIKSLAEVEREHICEVYIMCDYDKSKAAKILGLSRATLYRKLEVHQIKNMKRRRTDAS